MQHRIVVLGAGYAGAIAAGRLAKRLHREDVDHHPRQRRARLRRARPHAPAGDRPGPQAPAAAARCSRARASNCGSRRSPASTSTARPSPSSTRTAPSELGVRHPRLRPRQRLEPPGVPGTAEHAYEIASRPGALRLRERLARLDAGRTVVVVGGGLTGLEAATEIAEARPDLDVALAARGGLGDWLSDEGPRHLRKVFDRLGITVHEHTDRRPASRPTASSPPTAGRSRPRSPCGPPASPSTRSRGDRPWRSPAPARSWSTRTMRSVSHPDVYAIGDAGLAMGPGGKPLRMSCASGVPMAWQAADAIAARLTGGKLPNAPLRYFNQCISLGRREGLIQYVTADDRAVPAVLTGRLAAVYKELVCKGAAWGVANPTLGLPTRRRRIIAVRTEVLAPMS